MNAQEYFAAREHAQKQGWTVSRCPHVPADASSLTGVQLVLLASETADELLFCCASCAREHPAIGLIT